MGNILENDSLSDALEGFKHDIEEEDFPTIPSALSKFHTRFKEVVGEHSILNVSKVGVEEDQKSLTD